MKFKLFFLSLAIALCFADKQLAIVGKHRGI